VGNALAATGTFNLIGVDSGMAAGPSHGVNGNQIGSASSPIDPLLGPLASNGGLTLTHELLPGSPALDAGNNAIVTVATDQRGFARIADSDDPDGIATVDIGAYEAANNPPIATDDTAQTDESTAVIIAVLANDQDPDGDLLTVALVSDPPRGTANINADNTITYLPDPGFFGTDSFTYTIEDGHGGSDIATAIVTVQPVNDPPVATDDTEQTDEGTAVIIAVLANDQDPDGDPLAVALVSDPPNGTANINADNTITYLPDPNFFGTDSFTYTVEDIYGGSDTATVIVTVQPVSDGFADFNGDGYGDLVVGVFNAKDSATDAGAVHVIYGTVNGLTADNAEILTQDRLGRTPARLAINSAEPWRPATSMAMACPTWRSASPARTVPRARSSCSLARNLGWPP
jgi:hypothetical protein